MTHRRYCTFHVDRLLLGVAIDRVDEVLPDQPITPVPLAHPDVAGLLNLRGQIVTALDARGRLGLDVRSSASAPPTILVIRHDGEAVGLLVDRAGDVIDVNERNFEQLPETVDSTIRAHTLGAYRLDGALLLVLDPDETLAVTS